MPPIAILIALADTTRCRIIEILHDGPQPVHVLTASFAISRPAISRHLRVLKAAGLISEKKQGRENRYALHPARLAPVGRWLADLQGSATPIAQPIPQEPAVAKPRKRSPLSQMGFDF
jgi:DNA-binding transcriptional ArsR family regulator